MAIPVLAAVIIGASFTPAFAAVKLNQINETATFPDFSTAGLCGEDLAIRNFHINAKNWDNGKVVFHINVESTLHTFAGPFTQVGESSFVINFVGDTDDLPLVLQANAVVECSDGTTPANEHFGFTVDKNSVVHPHFPTV